MGITANVWKDHFPLEVSGGLPGRGVKELAFIQKRAIEQALAQGTSLGGYSLDLIKAYNTFGRIAVGRIMMGLGMPQDLIHAWVCSLDRMIRYPAIQECVSLGIQSTTGVPEGLLHQCFFHACNLGIVSWMAPN